MLALLKSVFTVKTLDLETKLTGAAGRGEIEYSEYSNGDRRYEIELRDVVDAPAEFVVNGVAVRTVRPSESGWFDTSYYSNKGDEVPTLVAGDSVEIRQNGATILEGVLRPD